MSAAAALLLALALDAVFGEPRAIWRRVPHPAVLMGRAVSALDARWNRAVDDPAARRVRGIAAIGVLAAGAAALGWMIQALPIIGPVAEILGAAVLLAHRSLVDHVVAVGDALRQGLAEGRAAVARIVGRDPESLDASAVARAAVESAAENFSDGVAAPAFWFLVGGLPGILVYKVVNTADSMIGHRTERHRSFGWASARLDDLLNLIPARLIGALFCAVGGGVAAARVMLRDARLHASPNAGWPEAAAAASLDLALAGPRRYGGVETADPWLHPDGRRTATPRDVDAAVALLWRAWAAMAVLLAGASLLAALDG